MSTPDDPYENLLAAAAEGARAALYERCDDGVSVAEQSRLDGEAAPLRGLAYPAIRVTAARTDGVPGSVYLCTGAAGARALAIRSLDPLPPEASDEPLQESDLEAAQEWGAEVLDAVAAAAAEVLGTPVALAPPTAELLASADAAPAPDPAAPLAFSVSLRIHAEVCVVVLALPNPDGAQSAPPAPAAPTPAAEVDADAPLVPAGAHGTADNEVDLTGTRVRVWAELGQVRLPLRRAIDLPVGGVVELDCDADAPVDLYVNGLRFAQGQLVITADGEWALRVDEIDPSIPQAS